MKQKVISCAIHDYLEMACMYGYNISCELDTGEKLSGIAITTETSKEKKEYLLLKLESDTIKIELNCLIKMTALQQNPYFETINF